MKREVDAITQLAPPREQVELTLARIEASAAFRSSSRHRALLRHLVGRMLDGDLAALKETMVAVEVFGRPVGSFDPKFDSIVRVEARRLRARLDDYYRGEGRDAVLRIELPVGSYVPLVAAREAAMPEAESLRRTRDLAERGEHFLRQALSKATLEKALARFDEALRSEPDHAPALVGMARAWFNLAAGWYHPPAIAADHAAEALRRALALDPGHAIAHALLGAIQSQFDYDWPAAERSLKRAIALAPNDAFVHAAYGSHLFMNGHHERAEAELVLARRLDPQYVNSRSHMVSLRISQGRLDDAEAEIEAMRDIAPDSISANGLKAVIALGRGQAERAVVIYGEMCERLPDHAPCRVALAGAIAQAGRLDEAEAMIADVVQRHGDAVSPYVLAIAATRCGRHDDAFRLLRRAWDERDPNALLIPDDISFVALHADPRWPALAVRPRAVDREAA